MFVFESREVTLAGATRRTYECCLRDEDDHEIVVRVVWPLRNDPISLLAAALAVAEARQSARNQPFEVLEIEVGDTPAPARVRRFPATVTRAPRARDRPADGRSLTTAVV